MTIICPLSAYWLWTCYDYFYKFDIHRNNLSQIFIEMLFKYDIWSCIVYIDVFLTFSELTNKIKYLPNLESKTERIIPLYVGQETFCTNIFPHIFQIKPFIFFNSCHDFLENFSIKRGNTFVYKISSYYNIFLLLFLFLLKTWFKHLKVLFTK
jgi:hypothetical protein